MTLFRRLFPTVRAGGLIDFAIVGAAIAECEFSLTFADAPLDQFARGDRRAMTPSEKRGAILFFGKANSVSCRRVASRFRVVFRLNCTGFRSARIGRLSYVFGRITICDYPFGSNGDVSRGVSDRQAA